jgi:hypothetical protein
VTPQRIADQGVLQAIRGIASLEGGGMQDGELVRGQDCAPTGSRVGEGIPAMIEGVLDGEVECRIACGDAIEVVRVSLCLHERFTPAIGASREVGVAGRLAVEACDQRFRGKRGQVHPSVGEVDFRLGVLRSPGATHPFVAHVRGSERDLSAIDGYAAS